MFVYWLCRSWLLLGRKEEQIHQALETDYWWLRQFLLALRAMFLPPTEI